MGMTRGRVRKGVETGISARLSVITVRLNTDHECERFHVIGLSGIAALVTGAPSRLEGSPSDYSEYESANMSHIGDATRLHLCHSARLIEELSEKPKPN